MRHYTSSRVVLISPGGSWTNTLFVSRFFDMTESGAYTLTASLTVGSVAEPVKSTPTVVQIDEPEMPPVIWESDR